MYYFSDPDYVELYLRFTFSHTHTHTHTHTHARAPESGPALHAGPLSEYLIEAKELTDDLVDELKERIHNSKNDQARKCESCKP